MKLNDYEKKQLTSDYKTNKYSQRELAKKYNVSLGTVSKLTKGIVAENEQVVNAQMLILSASSVLPPEEMNAIMNTAKDELLSKGLVYNASQLALIRCSESLSKNKKTSMTKVKEYNSNGQVNGETIELFEIPLEPKDIKDHIEAIDKASITLGVNQRHATTQINNTNAQQTNNEKVIKVEYS